MSDENAQGPGSAAGGRPEAPPTEVIGRVPEAPPTELIPAVHGDTPPPATSSDADSGAPSPAAARERRVSGAAAPRAAGASPGPATRTSSGSSSARTRHGRHGRHRGLKTVLGIVAALLVVGLVAGYLTLRRFNGNITVLKPLQHAVQPSSEPTFDPVTGLQATNILLMGSDTRAGSGNGEYGSTKDVSGARSDVQMIAHLSADRKSAIVVSIPRDTMVKGPADCNFASSQDTWTAHQFNSYFEVGGEQCTQHLVESMTGLIIDDIAIVDFTGFKSMVNALGSVEVCLTKPVKDPLSGANFPAGRQRLNGEQALSFVRMRYTLGDGSDIGRIKRQQDFLAAMIREATSKGVLLNPTKALPFADAAFKSLSATPGLGDVSSIMKLVSSVHGIDPKNISFVSMPWEPYKGSAGRVQAAPGAAQVWATMREDRPWPGTPAAVAEASASGSAAPSGTSATATTSSAAPVPVSTVLPKEVTVDIENASEKEGMGTQAATALKAQGFVVGVVKSGEKPVDGVVIHYNPADAEKAAELAAAFDNPTLKADGVPGQPLLLQVGRGAGKVKLVPNAPASATLPAQPTEPPPAQSTIQAKTADKDICSDTGKG